MKPTHDDRQDRDASPTATEPGPDPEQLRSARRIALESVEEDHWALERDAKLAFSPAALMGR
ncbi:MULTISPECIES: hypothetical protein [unclassified Streptomyces]|uniref:hypothetical protein n=1 Tax=unclassified Streptomyces TaxID=2593676 RepID=UPI0036493A25